MRNKQITWDSLVDFGGQRLSNLGQPTGANDAARKVDLFFSARVATAGADYTTVKAAIDAGSTRVRVVGDCIDATKFAIPSAGLFVQMDPGVVWTWDHPGNEELFTHAVDGTFEISGAGTIALDGGNISFGEYFAFIEGSDPGSRFRTQGVKFKTAVGRANDSSSGLVTKNVQNHHTDLTFENSDTPVFDMAFSSVDLDGSTYRGVHINVKSTPTGNVSWMFTFQNAVVSGVFVKQEASYGSPSGSLILVTSESVVTGLNYDVDAGTTSYLTVTGALSLSGVTVRGGGTVSARMAANGEQLLLNNIDLSDSPLTLDGGAGSGGLSTRADTVLASNISAGICTVEDSHCKVSNAVFNQLDVNPIIQLQRGFHTFNNVEVYGDMSVHTPHCRGDDILVTGTLNLYAQGKFAVRGTGAQAINVGNGTDFLNRVFLEVQSPAATITYQKALWCQLRGSDVSDVDYDADSANNLLSSSFVGNPITDAGTNNLRFGVMES